MNVAEALATEMRSDSGISTLVSTRIYPLTIPQDAELPAITYQEVSSVPEHVMGSDSTVWQSRIQINVWDEDYSDCKSITDAVRILMQDFTGTFGGGSGVTVSRIFWEDEMDMYEQGEKLYYTVIDIIIWWYRA